MIFGITQILSDNTSDIRFTNVLYVYIRGRQTCPKSVQYKRYGLQTETGSGVPQVPMAVDQGDRGPPGREIKI